MAVGSDNVEQTIKHQLVLLGEQLCKDND